VAVGPGSRADGTSLTDRTTLSLADESTIERGDLDGSECHVVERAFEPPGWTRSFVRHVEPELSRSQQSIQPRDAECGREAQERIEVGGGGIA
jgi:hypothetical protein